MIRRIEKTDEKVLFTGDTHGNFTALNQLILNLEPDTVIVAGDFGYWDLSVFGGAEGSFCHDSLVHPKTKIYFCDGNHEDHRRLAELIRGKDISGPVKAGTDLFYMPRGSVLQLNGRKILFAGGAFSIDRAYREEGKTWFPEEEMTEKDLERMLSRTDLSEIDTVVSHTCPAAAFPAVCEACGLQPEWVNHDFTANCLEELRQRLPNVRDWYFGHWHQAREFKIPGSRTGFHLLAMTPRPGCARGQRYTQKRIDREIAMLPEDE